MHLDILTRRGTEWSSTFSLCAKKVEVTTKYVLLPVILSANVGKL